MDFTRPVTQIHFVPKFSVLPELWISRYYGEKKSQSLVAVCSGGSAHFLHHTTQCAESRACVGRSMSPLLLHQSCSFCGSQWRWGGWWGGETLGWRAQRTTWPPTGARGSLTHSHTLSHTHTHSLGCVFIYPLTADLFECFFISPPPAIEWVNMLSSMLTYETRFTVLCKRLLHVPTNCSLLGIIFKKHKCTDFSLSLVETVKLLHVFFHSQVRHFISIHLIWRVIVICKCFVCS